MSRLKAKPYCDKCGSPFSNTVSGRSVESSYSGGGRSGHNNSTTYTRTSVAPRPEIDALQSLLSQVGLDEYFEDLRGKVEERLENNKSLPASKQQAWSDSLENIEEITSKLRAAEAELKKLDQKLEAVNKEREEVLGKTEELEEEAKGLKVVHKQAMDYHYSTFKYNPYEDYCIDEDEMEADGAYDGQNEVEQLRLQLQDKEREIHQLRSGKENSSPTFGPFKSASRRTRPRKSPEEIQAEQDEALRIAKQEQQRQKEGQHDSFIHQLNASLGTAVYIDPIMAAMSGHVNKSPSNGAQGPYPFPPPPPPTEGDNLGGGVESPTGSPAEEAREKAAEALEHASALAAAATPTAGGSPSCG